MAKKNPFAKLEENLGMATSLIEELKEENLESLLPSSTNSFMDIKAIGETLPAALPVDEEIFNTGMLKQDFLMVRQNIMSLISKGQRMLDSAGDLDATEMKASQIEAISSLSNAVSANLKLLLDSYEQITKIEKNKINKFIGDPVQNINTGQVTTNNIVFSGSPNDLLKILKDGAN